MLAIFSISATAAARKLGHFISFGVTLVLMTVVDVYVAYGVKKRKRQGRRHVYGPLILVLIATPLILADPTRHILQDTNIWPPEDGSAEYRSGCGHENMSCLSATGWIMTFACTYIGFALLVVGTMWNANIIEQLKKIRDEWRVLRGRAKKGDAAAGV